MTPALTLIPLIVSLPRYECSSSHVSLFRLINGPASKGCKWCTQWRCQAHKGGSCQLDQSNILSNNSSQREATRWPWSSEWHHRSLVMPNWTFLGWWRVRYTYWRLSPWHICSFVVFVARFKLRNSIYLKIIFSLAFIPTDLDMQMMWNMASFVVVFWLRYANLPSIVYLLTEYQTFCALFTSPSSSEAFDEQETQEGPSRKKQKTSSQKKATKSNVATLLHMEGRVTPRAIAYAATLVCSFISDLL